MGSLGPFPPYGWSHSRQYLLDACARRYYHHTYGSWDGWDAQPDDPAWLTYRLKKLVSPAQLAGTLVHEAIRAQVIPAIQGGRALPDPEELIESCLARLREVQRRTWEEHIRTPKPGMLRERYLGLPVDLAELCQEAADSIDVCLYNLLEHPLLPELRAAGPARIVVTDSMASTLLTYADGVQIPFWAAPDLVYYTLDDPPVVMLVDWKTGSLNGVETQIAVYAVYVRAKWNIPFARGRFRGLAVDLQNPARSREIEITRDMIVAAGERIREGERAMARFRADAAVNRPLPKEAFPMVDGEDRWKCGGCVYARICSEDRYPGITRQHEEAVQREIEQAERREEETAPEGVPQGNPKRMVQLF